MSLSYLKFFKFGHLVLCSGMPVHLFLCAKYCIWKILGIIWEDLLLLLTHRVGTDHLNLVWEWIDEKLGFSFHVVWSSFCLPILLGCGPSGIPTESLGKSFSNFIMHPIHLKDVLKHRFLGPIPKVSHSIKHGSKKIVFPTSSQALLMLLVWEPLV